MIRNRFKAKLAALLTAFGAISPLLWGQSERAEFFETRIRPVLAENCYSCHTQLRTSGLRVDSRQSLLKGGNSGPAILPGNPDESLLIRAVRHTHDRLKMPPAGKLSPQQIEDLAAWVQSGAYWPEKSEVPQKTDKFVITPERRAFWSFQPLQVPKLPKTGSPVDYLVRKKLDEVGLKPNPPADRRSLLRRLSFDLLGLPPSPEEVETFVSDTSPKTLARTVDRLLESPHFGERWGRFWLDVARYGENDYSGTEVRDYPQAWRYRDWVIGAFNADMPYDLFVKAQIAADLLPGDNTKLLGGLGLFGLGPWYYSISHPPQARADERHERVDMVSRGFLGLTAACARCHDHKYDPISMEDYYGLAGVFANVHYKSYSLVPAEEVDRFQRQEKKVKDLEKMIEGFLKRQSDELGEILAHQTSLYMQASWKVLGTSPSSEETRSAQIRVEAESRGLDAETLTRWAAFLDRRQEEHPFLEPWFRLRKESNASESEIRKVSDDYQELILSIIVEKKAIEEEMRLFLAKLPPPEERERTRLPGGFVSGDGFEVSRTLKGTDIEPKSLSRDRYVAWKQLLGDDEKAIFRYQGNKLERFLQGEWKKHLETLRGELERLKSNLPSPYPYLPGIEEWEHPENTKLNIRGNPFQEGHEVPRRFLAVLSDSQPKPFQKGSGRLELAEEIVAHPLTARVMANRVWQHLLGSGTVRTPDNFGKTGDRPSNPELLEYLAWRLVDQKWSVKQLIREIVLSQTYQASSDDSKVNTSIDPSNRFFWRVNRRRLDAEAIRDSILSVSGQLEDKLGGASQELTPGNRRRTVYLKVGRFKLDETLALFDVPSPSVSNSQRGVTNVPLQRLFFLNSEFVLNESEALVKRLRTTSPDDLAMISKAYHLLFSREPSPSEVKMARAFLETGGTDAWTLYAQALLSSNEFVYVD
jgi:Protein of unknown function (DUF1553)/Protein of unknown function (DUF1549)/Planctomycete cytochrome C